MKIEFLKSSEKKKIIEKLNEQFGVEEIPHLLIESGKEKIRGYTGHLSKEEINEIYQMFRVDSFGLYLMRIEPPSIRLSLDGAQILNEQIKKNTLKLNDEQIIDWLKGKDVEINSTPGIFVIEHDGLFFGCGKSNGTILFNHVPKDRRLKRD